MSQPNLSRAKQILHSLIQGIDPLTGEELPSGTVLCQAEVIRTLLMSFTALDEAAARAARRAHLPPSVGKAWSDDEEAILVDAFKSGDSVKGIAERHGRTVRAIEARLEKLGLITATERTVDARNVVPRKAPEGEE